MTDVQREISLGQFVKLLAALLQKKDVQLPFKNQKPWHSLFYELSKLSTSEGKPRFFDELVFDWDAPYPKSQELSEFLHALHFTASVSAGNPSYAAINIDPVDAKRWAAISDTAEPTMRQFVASAVERAKIKFKSASVD